MTHPPLKRGIPVLAYSDPDTASPLSSHLVFKTKKSKHEKSRAQATLCLQSSLLIDGCDNTQIFVLQYNATNIAFGKAKLGPATIALPQTRLDEVSRDGNPQIRTLSLTLKRACPVWCRPSCAPRKPWPGDVTLLHQLAKLAQATRLHVLFDYNQLHSDHHATFEQFVKHPELFEDFPVRQHYQQQGLKCVDWLVPYAKSTGADANAGDTTEDELPTYAKNYEPLGPVASDHTTRSFSPHERISPSPCPSACTSLTEKDSRATPSPAPPYARAAPSPHFPPLAELSPRHPHSPVATRLSPTAQDAIERTVKAVLPDMIESLLPSVLKQLVTTNELTPSSQQSIASEMSHSPPPPTLTEFGVMLSECLAARVEGDLDRLYSHMVSHGNFLRNEADGVFFEERETERLEFARVAEEKLEEFKQRCEECGDAEVERVEEKMEELGDDATERREGLKEENLRLKRELRELRRDKADLRKDKKYLIAENLAIKKRSKKRQKRLMQYEQDKQ